MEEGSGASAGEAPETAAEAVTGLFRKPKRQAQQAHAPEADGEGRPRNAQCFLDQLSQLSQKYWAAPARSGRSGRMPGGMLR